MDGKKRTAATLGWEVSTRNILALLSVGAIFFPRISVAAMVEPPEETLQGFQLETITVEAKRPDWERKLSPGTVTIIRPADYKGEQKTLPDLLKEVPGVHVREVNGKGQYTTVTVRGSTAAQVGVFVDGVMTNLGGDAAVDISTIPVKNVERIEVYRGYIPARFGGTFIGGVINVVTKKPEKADINAEIGKAAYGGASGSLEITAPLGNGSLLVGINHEASDGNFKYNNYAALRKTSKIQEEVEANERSIKNFNLNNINLAAKDATLSQSEIDHFVQNEQAWRDYIHSNDSHNSLAGNVKETYKRNTLTDIKNGTNLDPLRSIIDSRYGDDIRSDMELWSMDPDSEQEYTEYIRDSWRGKLKGSVLGEQVVREQIITDYKEGQLEGEAQSYSNNYMKSVGTNFDPDTSSEYAQYKKDLKENKRRLALAKNNERYRKYNDYKNTSILAKWQNDNWMAKLSYNKVDRHLPDTVWGDSANDAMDSFLTDVEDIYYADSRRQKLVNTEALVENRRQNGKLEWGWRLDYLNQDKKYRTEHKLEYPDNFRWKQIPLREWSKYKSNKFNLQTDGSYKLSERQMLDFQANYSHEKLNIKGSLMDKVLGDDIIGNILGQMRNRYVQKIFNIQLQDSITLDSKGTLLLTPAIRYNQSEIIGYSDGKRFGVNQYTKFHWLHPKDSQRDGKVTWQLALRKDFNDSLSLRATGGTYFRLLNMYEIAGDGAGILPASRDGSTSVFPLPEEGKQFDCSALWKGKLLGADNSTTVTWFWRDSDNMLQLYRAGLDYWSYFNDNRGKAHGWELQSLFKWNKFSLDMKATQTKMHVQQRNSTVHYDYMDVHPTYQPEWESNIRFSYHPDARWDIFAEQHHTGGYFTMYSKDNRGGIYDYLAGKPVSALTVYNAGIKWKPNDRWQVTLGCNDLLNKGPKQKIRSVTHDYGDGYINADYPLQGRTWYATVRHAF